MFFAPRHAVPQLTGLPSRLIRSALLLALLAQQAGALQAQATPAAAQVTLPLKTARTHTFTTTKGTWMSVDVSPDGLPAPNFLRRFADRF